MINIAIEVDHVIDIDNSWLEKVASYALNFQSPKPNVDLSIIITDNNLLQELNREYLGIDAPTDVLSFNVDEIDPETGNYYLGDIIISYQKANEQAVTAGHEIQSELSLLIIHGVLHLLGMDHDTPESQEPMWKIQDQILSNMGLNLVSPKY
ncbi:MAG TPA: rRNA maturation RNase YbeY [Anaerolineaceae bacterium]|nr:rRNA maturation RNase YbeY [Anaerolineaceae bacterium]HOH19507.1 rRNA maturation RNase YbeY [Anaerolineaceae bacterium]HOU43169.1 rRNA maturation RNase YbeY [Anaerolineaceae bacterium]HQF44647.1 rRNA maturation RNase YbeY [Anaerolineaceae bacterium]HQH34485.1 rRNA maturation RNase YbeY [Anaerolineaceae bacterium]